MFIFYRSGHCLSDVAEAISQLWAGFLSIAAVNAFSSHSKQIATKAMRGICCNEPVTWCHSVRAFEALPGTQEGVKALFGSAAVDL